MKKRIKYLFGFVITMIIEVLIALYIHDDFIRPYLGDVLVIICIYLLLRTIIPNKINNLSIFVLILGVLVEIMQYFNAFNVIAGDNKILRIALGTTFDIKDIVCYVVGYILIVVTEIKLRREKIN